MKNSQKLLNIYAIKKIIFFVCVCIKWNHLALKHGKKFGVEAIKHNDKNG